jgi:hypothetical protein
MAVLGYLMAAPQGGGALERRTLRRCPGPSAPYQHGGGFAHRIPRDRDLGEPGSLPCALRARLLVRPSASVANPGPKHITRMLASRRQGPPDGGNIRHRPDARQIARNSPEFCRHRKVLIILGNHASARRGVRNGSALEPGIWLHCICYHPW